EVDYFIKASASVKVGEGEGPFAALTRGVLAHHVEVDADVRSKVSLVDDEKIGAGDAGPALARDFLALTDGDDVDRQIGQVRREGRRQIVAARLDEHDVEIGEPTV